MSILIEQRKDIFQLGEGLILSRKLMLLKLLVNKKAQSIIEYVMLFVIIAGAVTLTYKYVYRSMNARLKQVQEELTYKRD